MVRPRRTSVASFVVSENESSMTIRTLIPAMTLAFADFMFVVEFQYKTTGTYDFQMDELRRAKNWLELFMFVALG